MSFVRPLSANVIHNLVLTLTRDACIRNNNFELGVDELPGRGKIKCVTHLFPTRVVIQLLDNPIPQRLGQELHERRAWCNSV